MRRLEGLVKEIVDEMGYLKKREERFANTNGMTSIPYSPLPRANEQNQSPLTNECKVLPGSLLQHSLVLGSGKSSTSGPSSSVNILLIRVISGVPVIRHILLAVLGCHTHRPKPSPPRHSPLQRHLCLAISVAFRATSACSLSTACQLRLLYDKPSVFVGILASTFFGSFPTVSGRV